MKGTIDMKHLLLTSVLALALTPAFSAENPVFKLFPGDVTFYLSFDEENSNADMAGGKGEPARKIGTVSYADGVFGGKSLRAAARSKGFRTKCGSLCNIVYKPETICKSVRPIL